MECRFHLTIFYEEGRKNRTINFGEATGVAEKRGRMALQFILGSAGSGKSTFLYDMIAKEAAEHRDTNYFILVPDQFTLETQKTMVERSGGKGILNIDVLSFHRLAFRVFEQLPALARTILEDMGKTMLLRKVFAEQKERLTYFKKGIDKPGFLDECKSFLCELEQYGIRDEKDFERLAELGIKFQDIRLIYEAFKEKMGDTYMMAEELIPQLTRVVHEMDGIQGSVICLDGFTGFTPTQYELIQRLMELCDDIYVTVTTDVTGKRKHIFQISQETIFTLTKMANHVPIEVAEPIYTGWGKEKKPYRFSKDGELAFLERNLFSYTSRAWEEPTEELQLFIGKKPADEAKYVARQIWWMVAKEGYRYEDIAVITGDVPAYEHALSREFSRMGVRYFLDSKKNIGANWVAELIQSVLELLYRNMDYESTFHYLRCGLSPLTAEETDCLENYILATGKRGFSAYDKEWKRQIKDRSLEEINASREKVCDSLRQITRDFSGGSKTVGEYTRALYDFLVRQNVYEKMLMQSEVFEEQGQDVLAKEYKSVYKIVMNLFDQMMELMENEVVSLEEYRQILSAGISEGLVGFIPPKKNQVVIGDLERTRLKDVKILFFMGFSDDMIPGGIPAPGIVNTRERKRIEEMGITLAPFGNKKAANDLFYLYLNMTKPSEKLIFTYSESSAGGEGRQASYVLEKIRRLFPALSVVRGEEERSSVAKLGTDRGLEYVIDGLSKGTYQETGEENTSDKEAWWELWKYYKEKKEAAWITRALQENMQGKREGKLSQRAMQALYGEDIQGSITRLEQFAKCPFAYFIMYGLSLREREEYSIEAPDFGNVVHQTLQGMNDRMQEQKLRWRDLTMENIPTMVDESVEKIVSEYRDVLFRQSKRIEFMVTRMKRMLNRTVWAISEQMRRGAFEQEYCEARFSYRDDLPSMKIPLDGGSQLLFSGVIDRVDTYEDEENIYVKIVDYKTGGTKLSLSSVFYGLQLQLVFYMAAAMDVEKKRNPEKNIVPAGMLYYHVKDPVIEMKDSWHIPELEEKEDSFGDEMDEEMLAKYRCDGYVSDKPEILQKMDSVFGVNGYLTEGAASACIPVSLKKDGSFKAGTHVLSEEHWKQLMEQVRNVAGEYGNQIIQGDIGIRPYALEGKSGCDYCGFRSICGLEQSDFPRQCRRLVKREESDIWKQLESEGGDA